MAAPHLAHSDPPTCQSEALEFYAAYNLPVTPVRAGDKAGRLSGWSQIGHNATAAEFRPGNNVGILNGTSPTPGYRFYDVDIDANSDAARRVVILLLPPTGWRYGRASKPKSHASYLVKGEPLRTRRYHGTDGKTLIELRGITQKGTYTLSCGPGSVWVDRNDKTKQEPIRFVEPLGEIGRVDDPASLDISVRHAAVGIVIQQVWPSSGRHNLRLAFAKVLLEHGLTPEQTTRLLEAVMEVTGSNVSDVTSTVQSTVEAMRAGQPTIGASAIVDVLSEGQKVLDAVANILRDAPSSDTGDGIEMRVGELSAIVDRAINGLLGSGIYQRGGQLVRIIKQDKATDQNLRRRVGATVLSAVTEPWLYEQLVRSSRWFRFTTEGERRRADPQPLYARTVLHRKEWPFAVLRGVVTTPTLASDGRIIESPGLDTESGLFVDVTEGSFPPIPQSPTKAEAAEALDQLTHPLRGFPFVSEAAKSVALSAMLTALVRGSLRTAPLHGFDAPTAGTGKSLLAEVAGLLTSGVKPPAMSQGKSEEEDEKRLSTVLFAGDPVIHIDNCDHAITGDFLCSMLTQELVQARILGQSERRVLPCTALVLASGNNLVLAGDASRRAVMCRLDAKVEKPDARKFDFDCHAEVLAARRELVVAGLTILRAYVVAGRPETLTPMGSFNDWEWVRGALVWLGCSDPAETRSAIAEADPKKDELATVMDLWQQAFGERSVVVADIEHGGKAGADTTPLRDRLIEIACRGVWSGKSVGWWLRRNKDRVVGGRAFRCQTSSDKQLEWRLEGAQAVLPSDTAETVEQSLLR
jgi:hypothetical protein